jgi:hypothetical protein
VRADAAYNLGVALCSLSKFELGIISLKEALDYYESSGQDDEASGTRWQLEQAELGYHPN